MKQTLPDYIRQNEHLRQILLAQDGGIMKYLAEHLDANGSAELFIDYQNQCVEEFFEKNKWDLRVVWAGDNMRRAALGEMEHLWKELRYQTDLKPQLAEIPAEVSKIIDEFTELYLTYAYEQNRLRWHPNGMTPMDIYNEVIGMYNLLGLAYKCMELILKEHHAGGRVEKTESDLWTEFLIRQWSDHLTLAVFGQMRQAVAEMLTGKTAEQCRQMVIDTMESLRNFSQMIYSDAIVKALRDIKYTKEADRRENDGRWLREVARIAFLTELSDHVNPHSMRYYFSNFINLLKDLGRIWAAQLLVHGIDMRELEKEFSCILNPADEPGYYVDKNYIHDLPDRYCIANNDIAEKWLLKMGHKPRKESYLEVVDKAMEAEVTSKLSKTYNQLKEEGLLSENSTKLMTFVDVLMKNADEQIVWLNDPKQKYLRTLIKVFLGSSKTYSYQAILKVNEGGSYAAFIQKHFVDENLQPIDFKTNGHEVGRKELATMDNVIKAIFLIVKHSPKQKMSK